MVSDPVLASLLEGSGSVRIGKLNGIFAPVSVGAHPRSSPHLDAATPLCPAACACRLARGRGSGCVSRVLRGRGPGHGPRWQAGEGGWHTGVHRLRTHGADGTTPRHHGSWA
jgi:hypothetical protein